MHYDAYTEMGSEFLTPDNLEALSIMVPVQKWVQNF